MRGFLGFHDQLIAQQAFYPSVFCSVHTKHTSHLYRSVPQSQSLINMPTFFDIKYELSKTPEKYISSISNEIKKNTITLMLNQALHLIKQIRADFQPPPDFPQIKIKESKDISPQGMDGLIEIPTGFIDYCLALRPAPFSHLKLDQNHQYHPGPDHPNILFCWAIAHEYHHGIRKHNIAADHLDQDSATQKAFELDADLCATASSFRWYQNTLAHKYSAVVIKQILFTDLYWALCQLPESPVSESHSTDGERLFLILGKVAHLRSDPTHPPDREHSTQESKVSTEAILDVLFQLEKLGKTGIESAHQNQRAFTKQLLDIILDKSWEQVVNRWDEIRHTVSVASGSKA